MSDQHEHANPNSGKFILEQLERFGSDINQKHEVSFWLYFADKHSAQEAGKRAKTTGLEVEISPPVKDSPDSQWLCLLYCPHVPDETLLDGISDYCTELAAEFGGKFDGWEASLELKEGEDPEQLLRELKADLQNSVYDES